MERLAVRVFDLRSRWDFNVHAAAVDCNRAVYLTEAKERAAVDGKAFQRGASIVAAVFDDAAVDGQLAGI